MASGTTYRIQNNTSVPLNPKRTQRTTGSEQSATNTEDTEASVSGVSASEEASVPEIDPDTEYEPEEDEYDSDDSDIQQLEELQGQMQDLMYALLERMVQIKFMHPATELVHNPAFTIEMEKWMADVQTAYGQMNDTIRAIDNKGITEAIQDYANLITVMRNCVNESHRLTEDFDAPEQIDTPSSKQQK